MSDTQNIQVRSKRSSLEKLKNEYPDVTILDLSSKGAEPWVRFSPFFPHGEIPVPFSSGLYSQSVEGIWQGLKVFQTADIEMSKFEVDTMKGLKRTVRRFGPCLGHRTGVDGSELMGYLEARLRIYLPSYLWVLQNKLGPEVEQLRKLSTQGPLIFLDYETNCDVNNLRKPLSHAGLVREYLQGSWPEQV